MMGKKKMAMKRGGNPVKLAMGGMTAKKKQAIKKRGGGVAKRGKGMAK